MTFDHQSFEFFMGVTVGALLAASIFSSELRGAFVAILSATAGGLIAAAYADSRVAGKLLAVSVGPLLPNPTQHLLFIVGAAIGAAFVVLVHLRK